MTGQFWTLYLPESVRVLAFTLASVALFRLFGHRQTRIIGRRRWLLAGAIGFLAPVQLAMSLAHLRGLAWLERDLGLIGAVTMLAVGSMLWPFLAFVRTSLLAARDEAVEARLLAAEAEARTAKSWLLLAEEIAHVGHWRLSHPDMALFWSDEMFRIHGVPPDMGAPRLAAALDFYHPDDAALVGRNVSQAFKHGTPYEMEARLTRCGGEVRYTFSRGQAEIGSDGQVVALFGVVVDITAQKRVELRLLEEQAKVEENNKSLLDLAMHDGLTGLPNRRHFDRALETETKRRSRGGQGLGLVMIDIDTFKQFNDHYGHPAGDECLRRVAGAIAGASQRPSDQAARYGGEEFVLLLPGVDQAGAVTVARRVIESVRELHIAHEQAASGRVTVSCGVAWFDPSNLSETPADVVERADRALYDAKHAGRDQLAIATPPPPSWRSRATSA